MASVLSPVLTLALAALTLGSALGSLAPVHYAPPPPPDRGSPRTSDRGGASRGGCPPTDLPLTALVPATSAYGGYTTAARPTLWVYQPYFLGSQDRIEFFIRSIDDQTELYRTQLSPSTGPGLMQVTLPSTAPVLEPGQPYDWYVLVFCNAERRRVTPAYTQGWLQRVDDPTSELAQALSTADPAEQSRLYAANGLWYEALHQVAPPNADNPAYEADRAATWAGLLEAVGLDDFVEQPLTDCCQGTHPTSPALP
jgi:hypothetical protein